MTHSRERQESQALVALCNLGCASVQGPTKTELDRGLTALHARIEKERDPRRRLVRSSLMGVAAVVATLLLVQLAWFAQKRMSASEKILAYQVDGGSVLEGGYLRGSGRDGIKLSFNEGSNFVLLPGSRGRLRAVDKEGARVAIENGTATFQVTPSNRRRWLVEVGPFTVTVKGTAFAVTWDPALERFELRLREGRVMVSGPISGGDLALRAGQRLVVTLPRAETVITEDRSEEPLTPPIGIPEPSAISAAAPQPPPTADKPAAGSSTTTPIASAGAKLENGRRWADQLASGHWDRILENVERRGVEVALNEATSEELFALADAARYRRRTDLAHLALLTQRRRFPNSPRALDAIFLLGRVEESRGPARAITWYDQYLSQAPTGTYAAEALGRKMTITNQLGGSEQARLLAEEYLRRFPTGSYSGSARALLRVQ